MHVRTDVLGFLVIASSPNGGEDHLGGARLSCVLGQEGQKRELLSCEFDPGAVKAGFSMQEVEIQGAEGHHGVRLRFVFGLAMTNCGTNMGLQLCHTEGFRYVVVCSTVECRNLTVLGPTCRQNDDRDITPLADSLAHSEPVDVGKAE